MLDFNRSSRLSDRINWLIDDGLAGRPEPPRRYLGCSAIGGECERAVQFHALATAYAERAEACLGQHAAELQEAVRPKPRVMRIFERGHVMEDRVARWLLRAGFILLTRDPNAGGQFAVSLCGGRLLGHADGVIGGWDGPGPAPIEPPALWECKVLGHKWVQAMKREGVRKTHPKYYGQVNLYMKGLGLERCLLTAVDADSMEIHHVQIQYDPDEADRLESRFGRIDAACSAGELVPRGETSRTALACRMCGAAGLCWSL